MYRIIHTQAGDAGKIVFTNDNPFEAEAAFLSWIERDEQGAVTLSFNNRVSYRHRFDASAGETDYCKGIELDMFKA